MMEDRKARLAALAARAGRTNQQDDVNMSNDEQSDQRKKTLKFRNYVPLNSNLDQAEEEEERESKRPKMTDDPKESKSVLQLALEEAQKDISQTRKKDFHVGVMGPSELTQMAPKKINWDLKRDIKSKLDKLERRTQRAIVELLKERLQKEASQSID